METITKEVFFSTDDIDLVPVKLPEKFGKDVGVYVRTITGPERARIENRYGSMEAARADPFGFRTALLIEAITDEKGKQLFDKKDVKGLARKSARLIEQLFKEACELNGFTEKDVEELEKNSEAGR